MSRQPRLWESYLERMADSAEKTLKAYNAANCEILKAMDAREGREIARAAEANERAKELHAKRMELINKRIAEGGMHLV